jgi:hypothetical protein
MKLPIDGARGERGVGALDKCGEKEHRKGLLGISNNSMRWVIKERG